MPYNAKPPLKAIRNAIIVARKDTLYANINNPENKTIGNLSLKNEDKQTLYRK